MNKINKIAEQPARPTQWGAFLKFWEEASPEAVLLEAWFRRFREAHSIIDAVVKAPDYKYYNAVSKAVISLREIIDSEPPSALATLNSKYIFPDGIMNFISQHERAGTTEQATTSLANFVWNSPRELVLRKGELKKNFVTLDNVKMVDEPFPHPWVKECDTAKDVILTIWANFFKKFLELPDNDAAFHELFERQRGIPASFEAKYGVFHADEQHGIGKIMSEAQKCLLAPELYRQGFGFFCQNKDGELNEHDRIEVAEFKKRARGFLDVFAPEPDIKMGYR